MQPSQDDRPAPRSRPSTNYPGAPASVCVLRVWGARDLPYFQSRSMARALAPPRVSVLPRYALRSPLAHQRRRLYDS